MTKTSQYFKGTLATAVAVSSAVVGVPSFTEASTTFKDVSEKHNFQEAITNLAERGIIKGFEDGTFRPAASVTRGQAAKIIAGILELDTENVKNPGFKDVTPAHPYYGPIAALANAGIISGYEDNTYRSGETVQRNHMAKIIAGAFNLTASPDYKTPLTDVNKSYEQYIKALHEHNVTTGVTETTFNGTGNVTRGQLAAFVVRAEQVTAAENEVVVQGNTITFTVADYENNTIVIGDNTYTYDDSVRPIFTQANKAALAGASMSVTVADGVITKVNNITLNKAGYSAKPVVFAAGNATVEALTINANYVSVKDLKVTGNATVTNKATDKVEFTNVAVTGNIIVDNKGAVASTNNQFAQDEKGVEVVANNTTAANIIIRAIATLSGNANLALVTVEGPIKVTISIEGTIATLTVTDAKARVTLGAKTIVTTLNIPANTKAEDIIANLEAVAKQIEKIVVGKAATENTSTSSSSGKRNPKPKPEPEDTVSPTEQANLDITNAAALIGTQISLLFNTPVNEATVTEAINKIVDTTKVKVTVKATATNNVFTVTITDVKGLGTAKTVQVTVVLEQLVPQALLTSADSVNINTPTTLPFTVNYSGTKEAQLTLLKKGASGYEPFNNVALYDKGDQSNADLLAGDGIYSANVELNFNQAGVHEFAAGISVNGQWVVVSKPATILALQPLSTADAATVITLSNDIQQEIQKLQAAGTADSAAIKQEIVKLLEGNADVVSAGASESSNHVWYTLKSGALSAVSLTGAPIGVAKLASLNPVRAAVAVPNTATSTIGSQRVVVFSAHGQTEGAALATNFTSSDIPFSVDVFENNDASVARFKEMFNYGTIIFDTVGASLFKGEFPEEDFPFLSDLFNNNDEQIVLLTGEKVQSKSLMAYSADLFTGRLVIVDGYYAITPAFVKHYGAQKELNDALVYANNDLSLVNDTLATQFINNKAAAYVGYDNTSADTMTVTFNNLLDGKTLADSVQDETIKGTGALLYSKEIKAVNGNFENGEHGWISGGHFDSVSKLGLNQNSKWATITPAEGKYMGIISSGVDDTALNSQASWVYQTFTVPADANVLKFNYNVVSNEPMEYVHSGFDDTFKATIVEGKVKEPTTADFTEYYGDYTGASGIYSAPWLQATEDANETIIAYESINSSYWGKNYEDESLRVDAEFPDGDDTLFMTGWKTLTYDVSKFKGKTVTLKLQTWDLGDSAYPTAVLFDNVRFATAEPKALTITGPKTIATADEKREYQFNALAVDQFGHTVTGDITLRENNQGYRQPVVAQAATFSLKAPVAGASIDKATGLLTLDSSVTAKSLTIVAEGKLGKAEVEVPVIAEQFDGYYPEFNELNVYVGEQYLEVTYSNDVMNYLDEQGFTELKTVSVASSVNPTAKLTINKEIINNYGNGFYLDLVDDKNPENADTVVIAFENGSITLVKDADGVWVFNK